MELTDGDVAEFAELGIWYGLFKRDHIRKWADSVIEARDDAPDWALDLSMAEIDDMIGLLRKVPGEVTDNMPVKLLVALVRRLWKSGELSIPQMMEIANRLNGEDAITKTSEDPGWAVRLFCEIEEYEQGFRSKADIRKSIDEKLSRYAEFEAHVPSWA